MAAAELTVRLCLGVQLDAKYVDVIVQRWQARNGDGQTLETDGRTFTHGAEGNLRNRKRRCVLARSKWRGAARLVQRLAVDRAADGFENLHSTPAPRNGLRSAKFRSAASSHSRNAV